MYSRKIIEANLSRLQATRTTPLYYYSSDYIQACVQHLQDKAIFDDKGRFKELKSPLLPDEQAFIRNEQILVALDYDHWATNYHMIRDSNTQEMIRFKRNFAQEVMQRLARELEEAQAPIMIQSLKARQLGITTWSGSIGQHRAMFIPNTSGVLASSDEDKTWKLAEMFQRSLLRQPWWLLPGDLKQYVSGEVFIESPKRNMTIAIQHGRQTSGISRGDTVNYYHLSEIPDFTNPEDLINASLMKAMHPTNLTIGVLESTANGRNDWWHLRWQRNQELAGQGRGLEKPVFLPWYMGTDIYPTRHWLNASPIPTLWSPPEFILAHARKAREYVLANRLLWQALGQDWELPLEQLWYYWNCYEDAKAGGELALAKFYSEMPANDLEAFQSRQGSVFSIELVQSYANEAKPLAGVYAIQGEGIPTPLWPEESNRRRDLPEIPVGFTCARENKVHTWRLVPQTTLPQTGLDRLLIWEHPRKGYDYSVSLDGAEGKGLDRTVLQVTRKGTPMSPPEQVAELATDKVGTLEIAMTWLCLLRYYSPVSGGGYSFSLAAPEVNRGGDAALMQIRQHGWPSVFRRLRPDSRTKLLTTKLGWETTPKTRDQLVHWLLYLVKGKWIQINSQFLIDELRDFVVNQLQSKIRLEHGTGSHDDRIFSLIIGLVCLQGLDLANAETPNWLRAQEDQAELEKFPVDPGHRLSTYDPEDNLGFTSQAEVVYAEDSEAGSEDGAWNAWEPDLGSRPGGI